MPVTPIRQINSLQPQEKAWVGEPALVEPNRQSCGRWQSGGKAKAPIRYFDRRHEPLCEVFF
jgi:hypothetical protein